MELIILKEDEFFETWNQKTNKEKDKCMANYKKVLGVQDAEFLDVIFGYNGKKQDTT